MGASGRRCLLRLHQLRQFAGSRRTDARAGRVGRGPAGSPDHGVRRDGSPLSGPSPDERSLAEVALRLAEPENIASEKVASVGNAIRREVAALGEGVERPCRAWASSRHRPQRGVVARAGLRRQRGQDPLARDGSLVRARGHAEPRGEPAVFRGGLARPTDRRRRHASTRIIRQVEEATQRFHALLDERGAALSQAYEDRSQALTAMFDARSREIESELTGSSATVIQRIGETAEETTRRLAQTGEDLARSLRAQAEELQARSDELVSASLRSARMPASACASPTRWSCASWPSDREPRDRLGDLRSSPDRNARRALRAHDR